MESFTIVDSAKIERICFSKKEKILAGIKEFEKLHLKYINDSKIKNRKRRFLIYKLQKPFCLFFKRDFHKIEQILQEEYPELSFYALCWRNSDSPYIYTIQLLNKQIKEIDKILSLCNNSLTGKIYLSATDSSLIS